MSYFKDCPPIPKNIKCNESPLCQNCNRYCNPSGGVIGTNLRFWTCFKCGYKVKDTNYELLESKPLNKFK